MLADALIVAFNHMENELAEFFINNLNANALPHAACRMCCLTNACVACDACDLVCVCDLLAIEKCDHIELDT